jgi:hypothetical protein
LSINEPGRTLRRVCLATTLLNIMGRKLRPIMASAQKDAGLLGWDPAMPILARLAAGGAGSCPPLCMGSVRFGLVWPFEVGSVWIDGVGTLENADMERSKRWRPRGRLGRVAGSR